MKRMYLAAVLAVLALASPAAAVHYNRGGFVPAFQSCPAETANTQTTNGVPACAPPVAVSDCTNDPDNALQLRSDAKSAFTYRNTGRRETRANHGDVDILARVIVTGVETCAGTPYQGPLDVEILARMYREDDACATGRCVLPDFSYRHQLLCQDGKCELRNGSADEALLALGLPELPSDIVFSIRYLKFTVLDPGGRVLLANGLQSALPVSSLAEESSGAPRWLASLLGSSWLRNAFAWIAPATARAYVRTSPHIAKMLLTRYVQAYQACSLDAVDTATSDGLPACTAVPLSNCETDPDNAVLAVVPVKEVTLEGRGKFLFQLKGDQLKIKGHLAGIENCAGVPYTGPLTLRAIVRSTLDDAACGTEGCTTTDTSMFDLELALVHGEGSISDVLSVAAVGPFPGGANVIGYEVTETQILDRSGNVALEGPSTLVRCNPVDENTGTGFCYGN